MLQATTNTVPTTSSRNRTALLFNVWLSIGISLAVSNPLPAVPHLAPAFVLGSALLWAMLYLQLQRVREWADALPMRALVAAHAIRLPIGAVILWEQSMGRVSPVFGQRAGWGDMAVGAAAIVVALLASHRRRAVRAFAWFGLIDIAIALGTAMYLIFIANDGLMHAAISRQPYPFLPLAIVPLVVISHLLMLARTSARGGAA